MGTNFPGAVMLVTKLWAKYKLWQTTLFAATFLQHSCQSKSWYLEKLQNYLDKIEKYSKENLPIIEKIIYHKFSISEITKIIWYFQF